MTYRVGEFDDKQGFWQFGSWQKWALLAQSNGSWVDPNVVVRVNLVSGGVLPVDIPKADTLNPIVYIAERKQFLVGSGKGPRDGLA